VAVFGWVLAAAGVGVAIANLRTMRPLWRSPALERPQKIAQTALMWAIPGSYLLVRQVVMTPGAEPPMDPTPSSVLDGWASANPGEYGVPHPHHMLGH